MDYKKRHKVVIIELEWRKIKPLFRRALSETLQHRLLDLVRLAAMPKNTSHQNIVNAIKRIPYGTVCSYGEVAAAAGLPGRARLVAKILSDSSALNLPWHRVLRASGHIAFPIDSEPFNEQKQRLQAEGVQVVQGRVKREKKTLDLDALLWAPD